MKARGIIILLVSARALCGWGASSYAHRGEVTAYAIPLTGITIDGVLDDWPENMTRYPVLNRSADPGRRDPGGMDAHTGGDFGAFFMIGYNSGENRLYVAARVQDDREITGPDAQHTDACLVYVDGAHTGKIIERRSGLTADDFPTQKYVMCPPGGSYQDGENPCLRLGDIAKTKTRGAYAREGRTSVYEWAIEAFDHFPGAPTKLEAGKTLGLDLMFGDVDSESDAVDWISWARFEVGKEINTQLLGDLVLVKGPDELEVIAGAVKKAGDGEVNRNLIVDVFRDDRLIERVRTGENGHFALTVLHGGYILKLPGGQGFQPLEKTLAVRGDGETRADITVVPLALPPVLEKALAAYRSLAGYRDSIRVETRLTGPGRENRTTFTASYAFERPNRLRFESGLYLSQGGTNVFCDGKTLTKYLALWDQYTTGSAPAGFAAKDMFGPAARDGIMLVPDMMMREKSREFLMEGLREARETGRDTMNGAPVTLVELDYPAHVFNVIPSSPGYDDDQLITTRLWIGDDDFLVRKVSRELDWDRLYASTPERQPQRLKGFTTHVSDTHTAMEIDPVLPESTFAFSPPAGARHVPRFLSPYEPARENRPLDGRPAPGFVLKNLDGVEVPSADFEGKVLIVNFWATWCRPCREEIPALVALQSQYASGGFSVIGISVDAKADIVRDFAAKNGMNYPLLMADENVKRDYGDIVGIPTTFMIDGKGVIRYAHRGRPRDLLVFQRYVEELLAE